MALIFFLSSLPSTSTGTDTLNFKINSKIPHIIIFGVLATMYLFSLKWKRTLTDTRSIVFILSLLLTIIYAITDEYHQTFSLGRTTSIRDIIINTFGAIMFLSAMYFLRTDTGLRS